MSVGAIAARFGILVAALRDRIGLYEKQIAQADKQPAGRGITPAHGQWGMLLRPR
jgi:hypothetical protein